MTDIEELICAMQKEIKERYSYSDSEVTAYLQGQRDMAVDLASEWYEKGGGTNAKVDI